MERSPSGVNIAFPISGKLIKKSSLRMHSLITDIDRSKIDKPVNENIHPYMGKNREKI